MSIVYSPLLARALLRRTTMWLLFSFILFSMTQPLAWALPPLDLTVGEQKLLKIEQLNRYSLGNSQILRGARPPHSSDSHLLLKALKEGGTDLWVWKKDGSTEHRWIQVRPALRSPPLKENERRWRDLLSALEEVEVTWTSEGALLSGEFFTPQEGLRIEHLIDAFPEKTKNQSMPSPELSAGYRTEVDRWMRRTPLAKGLRWSGDEPPLTLEGALTRPEDRKPVEMALQRLAPGMNRRIEALTDSSPTLYFKVNLLEIRKTALRRLGIAWPERIAPALLVSPGAISSAASLELALDALESEGSVRVLSRPEIAVRVPGEAELFAGGELPIHSHTQWATQLSWKNYGLTLRLKTLQKAGRKVRLDILTEVSYLDHSISVGEVPGLQANRMRTQVDAEIERPLLLSGLLQEGMRNQAKGIPALRSLPVLGALFGSDDFQNDRSELVAVLTPYDSPPPPPASTANQPTSPPPFDATIAKPLHPFLGRTPRFSLLPRN